MAGAYCDTCGKMLAHCLCLAEKIQPRKKALFEERDAKPLDNPEQIEMFYRGRRLFVLAKRKAAQQQLDQLNRLLLAGVITGLELVRLEAHLEEIVRKQKYRLFMMSQEQSYAEKEQHEKGVAWV